MATYYVNVAASSFGGFPGEPSTVFVTVSGTGAKTSSSDPLLLNAGDTVGFKYTTNTNISSIVAGFFSTDHWTSTTALTLTSSYQYKTAKTGISLTVTDSVRIQATSSSDGATNQDFIYFLGNSVQPDTTISITDTDIEIATTDTSFDVAFTDTGDSTNSSITEYRVKDSSGSVHESRTGPGTITVTDTPINPGFPETYSIDARVTTANGGSGIYNGVSGATFTVTATTTATANGPTIDTYGMAIYDNTGTAITSFTGGHSVLREIFSGSTTLSTTGTTDIDTNLTGISSSNCIIMLEGDQGAGVGGVDRVPATFVTVSGSVHVRMGRHTSADAVKVTVSQFNGNTIGATSTYGWEVTNGDSNVVLDENSVTYGVKEVIDINTSLSTQTLYQNDQAYFVYLELTQGDYPATAGIPIPAISCSSSVVLIPPMLTATKHPDGSFKTVLIYASKAVALSNYKLAMLVSSDIATPSYYSGSADSYGVAVYDSSSSLIWHSGWRQAIVNNIIDANDFTLGTNQNGNYDVTTGYDGVSAPSLTTSSFNLSLNSTAQTKTISGVNEMDPANSYLAGCSLSGRVAYYKGLWDEPENGINEQFGGGLHRPGLKIDSNSSVSITMFRYGVGPNAPTSSDYGTRVPTAFHPEGDYVIFRIV